MFFNTAALRYATRAPDFEVPTFVDFRRKKTNDVRFRRYFSLLTVLSLLLIFACIFANAKLGKGITGQGDFVAYYSGSELIVQGQDLYNQTLLAERQIKLGFEQAKFDHRFALYVPAFFLAFSPLTLLPYQTAADVWFILNLWALMMATGLAWKMVNPYKFNPALCVLLAVFYLPVSDVLLEGQVTPILMLCATLSWYLLSRSSYRAAALVLLPFVFKPHLGAFPALILLLTLTRRRSLSSLLPALRMGIALIVIPELMYPGVHSDWMSRLSSGPAIETTASLVAQIAFTLSFIIDLEVKTIAFALSGTLFLGFFLVFFFGSKKLSPLPYYPLLLALAPAIAPYCWFSDYSFGLLVPIVMAAASMRDGSVLRKARSAICRLLLSSQFLSLLVIVLLIRSMPLMCFYAFVPVSVWFFGSRILRSHQ